MNSYFPGSSAAREGVAMMHSVALAVAVGSSFGETVACRVSWTMTRWATVDS